MSGDSPDLERKLRENKGRLLWPEFAQALSGVLPGADLHAQRLSVAATNDLRAGFFKRVESDPYIDRQAWDDSERELVEDLLRDAARAHGGREYALFHHLDRMTGTILVDGGAVLVEAAQVWDVVREDLCLTSRDLEHASALS